MPRLLSYLVAAALTAPLAGCFVATHPARGCGPGYHWDDGGCRPNGWHRGHDHDRRDDDDHDRGRGHDRDHRD